MARAKSPEKRAAILEAATHEIAEIGLSASTARIAKRAGVAEGTLFIYFSNKDVLFNELYAELKRETYTALGRNFPVGGSLEERARYVWNSYIDWNSRHPAKGKASSLLHLCAAIEPETRELSSGAKPEIERVLAELRKAPAFRSMPKSFVSSLMRSMQEAVLETIALHPQNRKKLIDAGFAAFWRAVNEQTK
ncbi:TetR/AcrR family transcriptional regulator [Granulicella cerasi]|uniref:TetR/AcrR family transcriptional regulator n=1 Tax=Granulicella cerasi TaxID=741063 RepID=A0ABW1Z8M3_9BACT|nr:TetR/AcrR family transcriptional regulator [Granulicella cerasi]